ncbi:unnamed protein product [Sphenostylis stenocarpa]|uniref:DNA replication ATP-dependent helicase/nuclease n=1 Tax=Sphenostylis stenocarpa TaxID=92480 RepID=A0AA86SHG0_9FABA|nr:unnamed protein product [Sphenostylis stenocarpa]
MAPKKKKPNPQQPSKFGIHHFFDRASQKHHHLQPHTTTTTTATNATTSTNTTTDNPPQEPNEVSPQTRFKFSPGMLVKQSQEDAVNEVTWKISPVNERLQAVSKHTPEVLKSLAASSKMNLSPIRNDSGKEANFLFVSLVLTFLDKVASPTPKVPLSFKRLNSTRDVSGQSPFRTPPSLSYRPDKVQRVKDVEHKGQCDQPLLRQNKKALLELLDQVEDAIAVDDAPVCNNNPSSFQVPQNQFAGELPVKVKPAVERTKSYLPKENANVFSNSNYLVLEVSELRSADSFAAQCSYKVLSCSVIAPGDTVHVIGQFDEGGNCDIDHDKNFLIVHPDILVSGTRAFKDSVGCVASSFSCPRRTVLDERLKNNDYSTAALAGTMLHQIFQAGLTKDHPTVNFMEDYAELVLQKNIESLYACGVNENDVRKTMRDAIPRILSWIGQFKNMEPLCESLCYGFNMCAASLASLQLMEFSADNERKDPNVKFGFDNGPKNVGISEASSNLFSFVIDIEEMVWAPKYGLKGMIDASVRVKIQSQKDEQEEKIMPIEFKTGKTRNSQACSVEHSAQGIVVQRSDLTGLIMRRNELASDILKALTFQQLPPMLQSPSICRGCRHLNVCGIYHKANGGSAESSGLGEIFYSLTNHMTSSHTNFLGHWDRLIDLEAKETELLKKEVWQSHSAKSSNSSGLCSIVLDGSQGIPLKKSVKENQFIYRFIQEDSSSYLSEVSDASSSASLKNDLDFTLRSGDHVVKLECVVARTIPTIAVVVKNVHNGLLITKEESSQSALIGEALSITGSAIHPSLISLAYRFRVWSTPEVVFVTVSFSKRLRIPGCSSTAHDLIQQVWRIDRDEAVTSFAVMRFNLVQLFLQNDQSAHLRRMIVDLEAPRFDSGSLLSQDPAISYVWSEKSLNYDQRKAILKILTAKDYALILGMPGTGKTSTLVHAVKALLIRGTSILLTAYTNSAVDNLLIKLKAQGIDFVRIGRHEIVNEEVREHCLSAMSVQGVEDIKRRLEQVKVVAVTCLGISSPLLANTRFDVCIMDEAGQTTLPVSLGPLTFASMFVLVGDHYQLPPLVQSTEARENGMGISLFCRLSEAHPQAILALQSQYRMCQDIMDLSNALIYGDRLRCGSVEVANAKLEFSGLKCDLPWLENVLNPRRPVIFIDTDKLPALESRDQKIVNNPIEAQIIAEVAKELVKNGIGKEHIGIITPYNSQANVIRQAACMTSLEIHTIDKYQGRDKDCILLSFVRSTENPTSCAASLLGDWHRINVALTRAKKKLIMVGSRRTLSKVPLLKLLISKVEEQSGILSVSKKDLYRKGELKRCSQLR